MNQREFRESVDLRGLVVKIRKGLRLHPGKRHQMRESSSEEEKKINSGNKERKKKSGGLFGRGRGLADDGQKGGRDKTEKPEELAPGGRSVNSEDNTGQDKAEDEKGGIKAEEVAGFPGKDLQQCGGKGKCSKANCGVGELFRIRVGHIDEKEQDEGYSTEKEGSGGPARIEESPGNTAEGPESDEAAADNGGKLDLLAEKVEGHATGNDEGRNESWFGTDGMEQQITANHDCQTNKALPGSPVLGSWSNGGGADLEEEIACV